MVIDRVRVSTITDPFNPVHTMSSREYGSEEVSIVFLTLCTALKCSQAIEVNLSII